MEQTAFIGQDESVKVSHEFTQDGEAFMELMKDAFKLYLRRKSYEG